MTTNEKPVLVVNLIVPSTGTTFTYTGSLRVRNPLPFSEKELQAAMSHAVKKLISQIEIDHKEVIKSE